MIIDRTSTILNTERQIAHRIGAGAVQDIQTIQPWLSQSTERLRAEFDPEKIILFGSWACGEATRRSDIDLFIVWRCDIGPLERIGKVLDLLLEDSPRAVDVIVYTPEELERCKHRPFIAQLLREGKVLYERLETA
ncbi:MAG: nucleotidyltransferase domain-containing protein [Cyanobacteria bacterium J06621_3]